ncbi:MAG: hypothetical protein OEY79_02695 [Anaplasmataceae bacterium]|nr:hypothetical protein [Anaplasmataceae bacterium]
MDNNREYFDDDYNYSNEIRSVWRAVILQAICDATSYAVRTESKIEKYNAREWLIGMSEEFKMVCSMAEYCPYYVRKKAMARIKKVADEHRAKEENGKNIKKKTALKQKVQLSQAI